MPSLPKPIRRSYVPPKKVVESKESYPEYHTHWWRKIRKRILLRDGNVCVQCEAKGRIVVASVCDHIKPVKEFIAFHAATYDDNLQSLCKPCHDSKRASERL